MAILVAKLVSPSLARGYEFRHPDTRHAVNHTAWIDPSLTSMEFSPTQKHGYLYRHHIQYFPLLAGQRRSFLSDAWIPWHDIACRMAMIGRLPDQAACNFACDPVASANR